MKEAVTTTQENSTAEPTKPAAAQRAVIDFKNTPPPKLQTLPPYLVDLSTHEEDLRPLLYYKGVGMFPRGDIQALMGERKSGKTTVARIFIVAMLTGRYLGFTTKDGAGKRIMIADTEQAPGNVERNTRRIHRAAGISPYRNNPDLLVLQLRPYGRKERLQIVCDEVARFRPDFVLLDGIVDVCQDFNDAKESGKAITQLLKLSADYDCAVLCVMHFNKDGETARGHLGAELQNKSSETYVVERKDSRAEVTAKYCRNDEIPPFAFEVETDGDSEQIMFMDCSQQSRQDREKTELLNLMRQVFDNGEPMRSTDIINAVMDIKHVENRAAAALLKRAANLEIVCKGEGKRGLYSLQEIQDFATIPNIETRDDEDPI